MALLLMAPFDILASLAMDLYLPAVPAMPGILGTSPPVVQLTLSLYMVVLGVGQVVFGPLSDRIGRRRVLIGGTLLFMVSSFLIAGTSTAFVFVALRIGQAAGAAAMLVSTFATVRDVYAGRPEGVVIYSLLGSLLALVPAFGPIAGALIADCLGWCAIFVTLGLLGAAALSSAWPRWPETRSSNGSGRQSVSRSILRSGAFWTYTVGYGATMGAFFVFFSTPPRLLIDRAGYSPMEFSLVFATAALVMIVTARFARCFVARWGYAGSLARGMAMLLAGAVLLAAGQLSSSPSFWAFILPMWVIAVGIVFAAAVTANGALGAFDDVAGTAVALYFCVQSLIVGAFGTLLVVLLDGDTAWPLAGYCTVMALVTLAALKHLKGQRTDADKETRR
jgi:DHA1 family florfenicol/chloramphenicol resistance protein-like MFS transporter